MRQFSLVVGTSMCLIWGLSGCQDGPNQTFSAPDGSAAWNDGRAPLADGGVTVPDGTATDATAPFAYPDGGAIGSGGTNANEICTQQQIAATNPLLNTAPIILPNSAANLDLAGAFADGGISWTGLTIEQAQQIDCQGTPESDIFGDDTDLSMYWNSGSVVAEYAISNQKLDYVGVGPGLGGGAYLGTMTITSYDGNTTYVIPVDGMTPISVATKGSNGQVTNSTLSLDWLDASNGVPSAIAVFDQIYRASMATFFPTYPLEPAGQLCTQTGNCIIGTFPAGAYAYFAVQPLAWAMWVNPYYVPVSANAINRMDIQFGQVMNYSPANPILKLDAAGPTTVPLVSPSGKTCTLSLGMSYQDFYGNCVAISSNAGANASETRELFSAVSHDEETINFDITGVDVAFSAVGRLGPTQVVIDPPLGSGCAGTPSAPGCPQANDTSFYFNVDQSTLGLIANDWQYDSNNNPTYHDLAGAGALYDDYRTITIQNLQTEICNANPTDPNCAIWFPAASNASLPDGGLGESLPDGGLIAAPVAPTIPALIQSCIGARDSSGNLENPSAAAAFASCSTTAPGCGLAPGCTGMEPLISADITQHADGTPNYDDPVNIGPIAGLIDGNYTLGLKMGHQYGLWCYDAMTVNQIAAQSQTFVCPSGASNCPYPSADAEAAFANAGGCAVGTCDPTQGSCEAGMPTCTSAPGVIGPIAASQGASAALTAAQVSLVGEVGPGPFVQNPDPANPTAGPLKPGAQVSLALPSACVAGNIMPQSHSQVANALGNGSVATLPIDIQDNRFFFKQYSYAVIQLFEASTLPNGRISAPVAKWGPPAIGSPMPVQPNDLYFDSNGDGQFETFEYVDRRFVCPDGANDCAPAGSTGWSCPAGTCDVTADQSCAGQINPGGAPPATPICNPTETAQQPYDLTFIADVKDGIMNSYDVYKYLYRGETALYDTIQAPGYAVGQASNALMANIFGSPLLNAYGDVFPAVDLTGVTLYDTDYGGALNYAYTGTGTPLTLAYTQAPAQTLVLSKVFQEAEQALVQYNAPAGGFGSSSAPFGQIGGSTSWSELMSWLPFQPLNGFDVAFFGNSQLDYFIQTSTIDFSGVTTSAVFDYNVFNVGASGAPAFDTNPDDSGASLSLQSEAVESQNFLGDVFMCYEPAANPPLLAIRMYTPTLAVLNWLNSVPQSYSDCGIVVRWSPYDNFVNLIESTTYGVRLQVTQGGGLGRIVGATTYVPNLPVEE